MTSIIVDGVTYVPENKVIEGKQYVICRGYYCGVHSGFLEGYEGTSVKLSKSRRLWYWDGAASLSQLSQEGTSKPDKCKFPQEISEYIVLNDVYEIIFCSEKAKNSIRGVKEWKE